MFTRFFNSLRESIGRSGPNNRTASNNNNMQSSAEYSTEQHSSSSDYSTDLRRRSSVTEELQNNDTHNMFSTSQSLPVNRLGRNNSIAVSVVSEPIPIETTASEKRRRRSSTVFGISSVTADDYVQKDLVSSSWS